MAQKASEGLAVSSRCHFWLHPGVILRLGKVHGVGCSLPKPQAACWAQLEATSGLWPLLQLLTPQAFLSLRKPPTHKPDSRFASKWPSEDIVKPVRPPEGAVRPQVSPCYGWPCFPPPRISLSVDLDFVCVCVCVSGLFLEKRWSLKKTSPVMCLHWKIKCQFFKKENRDAFQRWVGKR